MYPRTSSELVYPLPQNLSQSKIPRKKKKKKLSVFPSYRRKFPRKFPRKFAWPCTSQAAPPAEGPGSSTGTVGHRNEPSLERHFLSGAPRILGGWIVFSETRRYICAYNIYIYIIIFIYLFIYLFIYYLFIFILFFFTYFYCHF